MHRAAAMSFEQVKQWANSATAFAALSGRSNRAASVLPPWPVNSSVSVGIVELSFGSASAPLGLH
jgi:hypothetical protein